MSKLFISYRRKSWGFTFRLADELRERLDAEVFVDVDSIDQTDFEKAIVNHLRQSAIVLLVVSETTFIDRIHRDDDWVRREIREALALSIPLVMVCVDGLLPPSGLPDDIKDIARMQGINFYPEFFTPAVERLTDFVTRVSSVQRKGVTNTLPTAPQPVPVTPTTTVASPPERQIGGKVTLDEALDLLEKEDFAKAIFLLEGLKDSGFKSRVVNIDELLAEAEVHEKQSEQRRAAQIDYEEIAGLVRRRITHDKGLEAFEKWKQEYPDWVTELDTAHIQTMLVSPSETLIPANNDDAASYARRALRDILENTDNDTSVSPQSIPALRIIQQRELTQKFRDTETQVRTLRQQYLSGQLTRDDFKSQMRSLMVLDEDNNWWMIGVETDKWYRYENNEWLRDTPPMLPNYSSLDLVPKPFGWINIPFGKVTLGGNQGATGGYITQSTQFNVLPFSIAKYPLTNTQFAKFVEDEGYHHQQWWTDEGWRVRVQESWVEPRYWQDNTLNKSDYPVVGVSWYEAIAYCRWLSEITGENISLPTDQQWQRAAQGDTMWAYPYGDYFDASRCNFNTKGTTMVTQYEGKGDSPFGAVDMSGNVWEWCLTQYETGKDDISGTRVRVLRGGSLGLNNSVYLRVDFRGGDQPNKSHREWGFRIARS